MLGLSVFFRHYCCVLWRVRWWFMFVPFSVGFFICYLSFCCWWRPGPTTVAGGASWKMGPAWCCCWAGGFLSVWWFSFYFFCFLCILLYILKPQACLLQPSDSSSLPLSWSHLQFSKLWISLCLGLVLVEQTMTLGFTQGQICKLPHIIFSFCTNSVVNLLTRLLIFTTSTTILGCLSSSLLLLPPKSIFFPLPSFIKGVGSILTILPPNHSERGYNSPLSREKDE